MGAILQRSERPASPAELAEARRRISGAGSLGCAALFSVGIVTAGVHLGSQWSEVGAWIVGSLVAVIVTLALVGSARSAARLNARVRADVAAGKVELLDLRDAEPVNVQPARSAVSPGLLFDLDGGRCLVLVGQWLTAPETYGGSYVERSADAETDGESEAYPVSAPPYAFPTSEFTVIRLPRSGQVLRIERRGEYRRPGPARELDLTPIGDMPSRVIDCPVRGIEEHLRRVLSPQPAPRPSVLPRRGSKWVADAVSRRVVVVHMRSRDALELPELEAPFGVLVLVYGSSLRERDATRLEDELLAAGATVVTNVGGPAFQRWHGEAMPGTPVELSIECFLGSSVEDIEVTSFVVLVLDASAAEWEAVVDTTAEVVATYPDTRVHRAAGRGQLAEVTYAIKNGWPLEEFDDLAYAPLHYASLEERLDVIRALLAAGVDVDRMHAERAVDTPLGRVAETCSLAVARLLVDAGADPTIPGVMGMAALDFAARRADDQGRAVHALLLDAAKRTSGDGST